MEEAANSAKAILVKKVAEACDAVKGVAKKGQNKFQGYSYQKASDIAQAFRHELFSRGVLILPHEGLPDYLDVATKDGGKMTECRLQVNYEITDGIFALQVLRHGVARDAGDKALYKAQTGAEKAFLRRLGLIPDTREDPEADESVDRAFAEQENLPEPPAPRTQPARRKPPQQPPAKPESNFGRLFHMTAGAETATHAKKTDAEQRAYIKTLTGGSESANDIPPQKRQEAMKWAGQSGVPLPTEESF